MLTEKGLIIWQQDRIIRMHTYQLRVGLVIPLLNFQIGDQRTESQVRRVDGNFLKNPCPTAN